MRGLHDARRAVDRTAEKVVFAPLDNTQMQPVTNPERYPVGRLRVLQR